MKKHVNTVKSWILGHKITSAILAVILLIVVYKVFISSGPKVETVVVKRGDVIQKVIVNGKTKPVSSVDLAFQSSGTISKVYADIGTRVVAGQSLVALDSTELNAQRLKMEANLASEQAKLDETKKGTRPEELAVYQTTLNNAQTTLSDAQSNLKNKVVDAVNNKIDQLFNNPHTSIASFNLQVADSQLKNNINNERIELESIINSWSANASSDNLVKVKTFIDNVALAVNTMTANSGLSQTTLDGYKSDISTARSNVISAGETLNDAQSALVLAQKNLALKQSGNTPEAINSQEAKVMQAQADLESVNAQLSKTIIRSPQAGVVTKQDAKVGQVANAGNVVVSVISDNNLEIESNVSEVSIGKVAIGNEAHITFDAFPGETFKGKVTYIEPGETIVDGVVNYKVTVAFTEQYPQIKSGLTSKLEIITGAKTGVLYAPQYSLKTKSDGIYAEKRNGKNIEEVKVETGLKGQDGSVEILSGLSEGDVISATVSQ